MPLSKKQIFHTHTHTKAYALSHLCTHSLCKSKQRKKKTSKKKRADDFYLHTYAAFAVGHMPTHTRSHTHTQRAKHNWSMAKAAQKFSMYTDTHTHIHTYIYAHGKLLAWPGSKCFKIEIEIEIEIICSASNKCKLVDSCFRNNWLLTGFA